MSNLKEFTVISIVEHSGQILSDQVFANNAMHAFTVLAGQRDDSDELQFVAAIEGQLVEGQGIEFPGNSVVDSETVLSQPDVFS